MGIVTNINADFIFNVYVFCCCCKAPWVAYVPERRYVNKFTLPYFAQLKHVLTVNYRFSYNKIICG